MLPFAQTIHFRPAARLLVDILDRNSAVETLKTPYPDSENLVQAIRVKGRLEKLKLHVARKQGLAAEPGHELLQSMKIFDIENVAGTAFGFRSPAHASGSGLSVPELRFHSASEGGQRGGHIMEFTMGKGLMESRVVSRIQSELPVSKQIISVSVGRDSDLFNGKYFCAGSWGQQTARSSRCRFTK
jgi:acetolactate decarboxylase